jgi:VPS13-like, N-terminal/Vacuolar sorting-associated protein 13, extended-chorein
VALGHLGHLTLNIPWANLTSKPAEIIIEDLYLLVVPEGHSNNIDVDEEEARAQASKQERLKNAEVLRQSSSAAIGEGEKNPGLFESLINKVVNNLQITVKNIHIRYEDNLSVPGVRDSSCPIASFFALFVLIHISSPSNSILSQSALLLQNLRQSPQTTLGTLHSPLGVVWYIS